MWGVLGFYWMCLKRAFSGRFWFAEKISGGFALIFGAAIWFFGQWESVMNWLPFAVFMAVFIGTVAVGLILAPYLFFKEEKDRADRLTKRIEPNLRVRLATGALHSVAVGGTTTSLAGTRQTVETGRNFTAAALCTNDGLETLYCKCSLIALWKIDAEGKSHRLPLYESIELGWNRDLQKQETAVYIEPNETRTIYIAVVHPYGHAWLYRDPKSLPVEHQQLLGGPGKYQMLLQFKSQRPDPLQVVLDLETRAAPSEPNRLPKSEASLSIVEQGSPPLQHANIEA